MGVASNRQEEAIASSQLPLDGDTTLHTHSLGTAEVQYGLREF